MKQRNISRSQVSPLMQLSYGALSGYTLWIMIYPIDVVKSKIQTDSFQQPKYNGALDCFRKVFAQEGMPGFYRGFGACMLRAGYDYFFLFTPSRPANAVTFAAYEVAMNLIGRE
jgi:solute carrier family 25 carnitine/acylcarnitine transporter 20/29